MAKAPSQEDVFLREVDDELRRDEMLSFWGRYKKLLIGGLVGGLALFAGVLWWGQYQRSAAGAVGDSFEKGLDAIEAKNYAEGAKALEAVAASDNEGYRGLALINQATAALAQNDSKKAIGLFAKAAQDTSLDQPTRDFALVRQTHLEMDQIKPQDIVARMTPIAVKDNAWFGHAGEMLAIAKMKMGQKADAGKIYAALYKEDSVPETIRSRAVQQASVLGIDVSDAGKKVK